MKYLFIGALWIVALWIHVAIGYALPSVSHYGIAFALILTHMAVFMGYTAYFLYWGYKESEKSDER